MRESYVADRVKNGVFQAMMDVELKNDGPVGVDYSSEDAAVYIICLPASPPSRDQYETDKKFQVTIEINTNLPKKENKEQKDGNDKEEASGEPQRQTLEFKLPPELLQ